MARAQAAGTGSADELVVTLLGTGTPAAEPNRAGFANLVRAGDTVLLFDAGRNAVTRINQAGVPVGAIDAVFMTHYHSDHVNGLSDVFMTGYLSGPIGQRKVPLELYGPAGIRQLAEGVGLVSRHDAQERIENEHVPQAATTIEAHEIAPGIVYDRDGVKVTMFTVDHGIEPAVGYRVDYNGHSVVFSGDTTYAQQVVDHAMGADLLVHEVAGTPEPMRQLPYVQNILALHTTTEDAGRVFAQAQPRLAVLSHVVRLFSPEHPRVRMDDILSEIRRTYDGDIVVGEDLMQFRISDKGITQALADQ